MACRMRWEDGTWRRERKIEMDMERRGWNTVV
jgi:hypothetical protein